MSLKRFDAVMRCFFRNIRTEVQKCSESTFFHIHLHMKSSYRPVSPARPLPPLTFFTLLVLELVLENQPRVMSQRAPLIPLPDE